MRPNVCERLPQRAVTIHTRDVIEPSIDLACLPPCPFLPSAPEEMDWRALHACGDDRGALFYMRCLEYSQHLWSRCLPARAVLCLDRALFAEVASHAPELSTHPLPYRALVWMLARVPDGTFIGNPRVHYQHLADRVRGSRHEQRRARAWACWHLVRIARPEFSADPRHVVCEPSLDDTHTELAAHGIAAEIEWWKSACADALASRNDEKTGQTCSTPTAGCAGIRTHRES